MQYLTGVYWHRGVLAACNQDSVVLQQLLTGRGRLLMAAVCDGMGGLREGETASGCLAQLLQEWFYGWLVKAVRKKKPFWLIRRSLDRTVYYGQEQLRRYAGREQIKLGTTMSVLVLWERNYLIWHLGDSRIYLFRGGAGRIGGARGRGGAVGLLTRDHVKGGSQLTKCVGSFGYYRPDYRIGRLKEGDVLLVCSDGFYRRVAPRELADTLSVGALRDEMQIERRLKEIGSACMKRGETDNLSAVCCVCAPRSGLGGKGG